MRALACRLASTYAALAALALTACEPAGESSPTPSPAPLSACAPWSFGDLPDAPAVSLGADAIVYEIFVRSFQDTDGDGVGDLDGVRQRLPYIASLGADVLWLMPTFASPSVHGYDVTDFETTLDAYGGDAALDALLEVAHTAGVRVILDVPINHTSTQHPWFVAAHDEASPYRGWYRWAEQDPGTGDWYRTGDQWYYAHFSQAMPDLAYESPALRAEILRVLRGWLDRGVDGFRIDAARHLVEEGEVTAEHPGTFCVLRGLRQGLAETHPEAILVGEVWSEAPVIARYLDDGGVDTDEADLLPHAFDFPLASGVVQSLARQSTTSLAAALDARLTHYPDVAMALPFLTNHDMDRVASEVGGDVELLKMGAVLTFGLPGAPILYYGEEIGMTGARAESDTSDNPRRTPMQWTAEGPGYGFTTGQAPWWPVNADAAVVNVAAQDEDPASLLNHYRRLAALRRAHPALKEGDQRTIPLSRVDPIAVLRQSPDEAILLLMSFAPVAVGPVTVDLSGVWPEEGWTVAEDLLGTFPLPDASPAQSWVLPSLPARGYWYIRLSR